MRSVEKRVTVSCGLFPPLIVLPWQLPSIQLPDGCEYQYCFQGKGVVGRRAHEINLDIRGLILILRRGRATVPRFIDIKVSALGDISVKGSDLDWSRAIQRRTQTNYSVFTGLLVLSGVMVKGQPESDLGETLEINASFTSPAGILTGASYSHNYPDWHVSRLSNPVLRFIHTWSYVEKYSTGLAQGAGSAHQAQQNWFKTSLSGADTRLVDDRRRGWNRVDWFCSILRIPLL